MTRPGDAIYGVLKRRSLDANLRLGLLTGVCPPEWLVRVRLGHLIHTSCTRNNDLGGCGHSRGCTRRLALLIL